MKFFVALALSALTSLALSLAAAAQPAPAEPPAKSARPPADGKAPPAAPARPADPKGDGKGAQTAPKEAPKGAPGSPKAAGKKEIPGIAVTQPRTPAEREKALMDLYAHLATAADEPAAKTVAASIERLWLNSGSDTVALLMERASLAMQQKKPALALKFYNEIVDLAPDFAEGWNRRAYVHFSENNIQAALGDLRRVLALDANHYKALDGLVHILKDIGQKKAALAAAKQLLEVHPYSDGAKAVHDELAREVEGQAL